MYLKIYVNPVDVCVCVCVCVLLFEVYWCVETVVPLSSAKNKETNEKKTAIKPKGILGMLKP